MSEDRGTIRPATEFEANGSSGVLRSAWPWRSLHIVVPLFFIFRVLATDIAGVVTNDSLGYMSRASSEPFGAVVMAMNQLIQQLISSGEKERRIWKERIEDALGVESELPIVSRIIPELKMLLNVDDNDIATDDADGDGCHDRNQAMAAGCCFAGHACPLLLPTSVDGLSA